MAELCNAIHLSLVLPCIEPLGMLSMQGTPNYLLFKNDVRSCQKQDEDQWRSSVENRLDSLYTEFRNTNSQIRELLAIVKTGMAESLNPSAAANVGQGEDGFQRHFERDELPQPGMYQLHRFTPLLYSLAFEGGLMCRHCHHIS